MRDADVNEISGKLGSAFGGTFVRLLVVHEGGLYIE